MGRGAELAIKELEERVQALGRLRPSHREILEFYGALLKEQLKARGKIPAEAVLPMDGAASAREKGAPLLQGRDLPIDFEAATKLFHSFCRMAKRETQTLHEGIEKIQRAARTKRFDMDRFLGEMTLPDAPYTREVSSSLALEHDLLVFLGRATVQPFLEEVADLVREGTDLEDWSEGICPVCGSSPLLSELAESEGRRMLICSLCGYRWRGGRMRCPFCGTEDQKAHRYLFVEGDDAVRIDVCETCHKYIKTIDSRKIGAKIFPLLEYMGTLHLDILAQQEGYESGSSPFLDIR
jgi:FdhE protein